MRIGIDTTIPNQVVKIPPCNPKDPSAIPENAASYMKIPASTRSVSVESTYQDGSLSEIKNFRRPREPARRSLAVQCCIVGGGPAGMMSGYSLGRSGIKTVVLEKHADFFRDFRGDTVHPSTLQVMQELGLSEDFSKIPHQQLTHMQGMFGKTPIRIADSSRSETTCPFIALMPQWDFLNFLET
ncbi:hypothetical protein OY671_009524, partial [Metschnikowia pulcherrima]